MLKKNKHRGDTTASAAETASTTTSSPSAPQSTPQHDVFIIAINFGTMYSSVAWNYTLTGNTRILRNWPNQNRLSNTVPTTLTYSGERGTQWGHVRPSPQRLEWFQLLLNEPGYKTSDELLERLKTKGLHGYSESACTQLATLEATIKAIPIWKKPVDLAADYLREVYNWTKLELENNYPSMREELGHVGAVVVKWWLTVPTIWDDEAKELTRQAAIQAGMDGNEMYMISELEAAAVHCLTTLETVKENIKVGNVYVIVDCGGRAVDLIAYQVRSTNPLQLSERSVCSGELGGSMLINRRFEDQVIRLIGQPAYDKMQEEDRIDMRNYFDREILLKFFPPQANTDGDDDDEEEDDGEVCSLPGVPDMKDPKLGVRVWRQKITISTKDMQEIFEPVFTKITALVQEQVTTVEKSTGKNVGGVILIGSFSSSNYLAKWLEKNIRNQDNTSVRMIRPLDPSTALVIGAVQHGLAQHKAGNVSTWGIVKSRKARYHYGITVSERFRPIVHPPHKRYIDPNTGDPMCRGRIHWIIKKGEDMCQGVGIEDTFQLSCPFVGSRELHKDQCLIFDEVIYASADETAPEDVEHPNVRKLLTYITDLNQVPRRHFTESYTMAGMPYWNIPATFSIKLESGQLVFTTHIAKQVYGKGKRPYHHEELSDKGPKRPVRRRNWYCPNHGIVRGDSGDDTMIVTRRIMSMNMK